MSNVELHWHALRLLRGPVTPRMIRYGYHASHEQHRPADLLEYVRLAESAGFDGAMCSDHFHPWTETQGQSGFAWSWLGAALQATSLDFGTVTAPGWRYHPAIIAQAAATLADMYPRRLWLALGSGEALNEGITGLPWPPRARRMARLRECADVMRALWAGEMVTHHGLVTVEDARLYTRPAQAPLLLGAALGEETAAWAGGWADGLITIGMPRDDLRRLLDAFARGGGEGKPVFVQHALGWAPTEEEARRGAHEQWAFSALGRDVLPELRTPAQFAAAAAAVRPNDVAANLCVSADPEAHVRRLREYEGTGVAAVYLFNVCREQRAYVETFGERVLPALRGAA